MDSLRIHVFKSSFGPVVQLLNEAKLPYTMQMQRSGAVVASGGALEIARMVLENKEALGALATVVVAFITAKAKRKAIVTLQDGTAVHLEGYSAADVTRVLGAAASVTMIDHSGTGDEAAE